MYWLTSCAASTVSLILRKLHSAKSGDAREDVKGRWNEIIGWKLSLRDRFDRGEKND